MVAIFASATALLTPEFVESFQPEKLASKFVKVEKEFGVKFNKTNSTFNIVGHWEAIQSAHRSLRKLVAVTPHEPKVKEVEDRTVPVDNTAGDNEVAGNVAAATESLDGNGCTDTCEDGLEEKENLKKARREEKLKGGLTAAPIRGNPKRGRYTLESSRPSLVPEPVMYIQYQDKSYVSEDVINIETVLDDFEEALPMAVRNHCRKSDIKKVFEKNTEQMGRPLNKRKASDADMLQEYQVNEQSLLGRGTDHTGQGPGIGNQVPNCQGLGIGSQGLGAGSQALISASQGSCIQSQAPNLDHQVPMHASQEPNFGSEAPNLLSHALNYQLSKPVLSSQPTNQTSLYTGHQSVLSDRRDMCTDVSVVNSVPVTNAVPNQLMNHVNPTRQNLMGINHMDSSEIDAKFVSNINTCTDIHETHLGNYSTSLSVTGNDLINSISHIGQNGLRNPINSAVLEGDLQTSVHVNVNTHVGDNYPSLQSMESDLKTISVEALAHIRSASMQTNIVTTATQLANLGHGVDGVATQQQQQQQHTVDVNSWPEKSIDDTSAMNTEQEPAVYTELKCEQSDNDDDDYHTLDGIPSTSDLTDSEYGVTSPDTSPVKVVQKNTGRIVKSQTPLSAEKIPGAQHTNTAKMSRRKSGPVKYVPLDGDENGTEEDDGQPLKVGKAVSISIATKVSKVKPVKGKTGLKLRLKTITPTTPRPSTDAKSQNSEEETKPTKRRKTESVKSKPNKVRIPKVAKPKVTKPREPRPKKPPGQPPIIYKCSECDYQGRRKKRLTEHMGRVHGLLTANCAGRIENKSYPCDQCDKTFVFGKDLSRHKKIVHHGMTHFCTICQKSYKSKYVFDKHIATHVEGYVQPMFNCQVCPRQFTTKFSLAMHIKSEHLGIKKTFLCPTCGKSFSQIRSYRQHANVHAGIRPYVCEVCGKTFTYDKSLKEHRYMHDNIRRFACSVCNKAFRQRTCLLIHMKVHKESKDHICSSCGKGFTQKQSLIRHERIHSGVKPYTCALCRKSFSDYAVIRKHMLMSHKKEKDNWKEHCIQDPQEQSAHYIRGGPGYVPRDASVQIRSKTFEGLDPVVSVVASHDTSTIIDAKDVPQPQDILQASTNAGSGLSIDQNEEIYRKATTEQDIANLISTSLADKIQAAGFVTSLYAAQAANLPQQQLTIPTVSITNIKSDDPQDHVIPTVPINYSVPQNFTTDQLTEESIMNSFLKSDVYRQVARQTQNARDVFSPIIAPLAATINNTNATDVQRSQVTGFTVTSSAGETVLAAQPGIGPWGYAGYPAYYNPANFPQFQNPQN